MVGMGIEIGKGFPELGLTVLLCISKCTVKMLKISRVCKKKPKK